MAKCNDCENEADPTLEMRFDDIGEPSIHWCATCGQAAHALQKVLDTRLKDPAFAKRFEQEIRRHEKQIN